ncbi:MAG: hypothetical protein HUN04_23515 [Desulfobacter sp.]|nr:MAG: hypothetical protein HUN04_23515 [Desulfobacter sp.]
MRRIICNGFIYLAVAALFSLSAGLPNGYPVSPDTVKGVFLPPQSFDDRKLDEFLHYAALAGLNAAVLHVKDPRGRIYWPSPHPAAVKMNAFRGGPNAGHAIRRLKNHGIRVIAKVDVFADHLFAAFHPETGIRDALTGRLWTDRSGLHWTNPFDHRVWAYNTQLCTELAQMGFDEIQFDYIRFPSDGILKRIIYPEPYIGMTKAEAISGFLKTARDTLSPMNITISADVFGLTAWKRADFGVGQVIEMIMPHIDVICPMFYPSHFPRGFMGLDLPGKYPGLIMEKSIERLKKRTTKPIRPWLQGFWYDSSEIIAQLAAVRKTGIPGWTVWHASGNYETTYGALSKKSGVVFPRPRFYPSLDRLQQRPPHTQKGNYGIVSYTHYQNGVSILTIEPPSPPGKPNWSSPYSVCATLDEAVMDRILSARGIHTGSHAGRPTKILTLARLMAMDLKVTPKRVRPGSVRIHWKGESRFFREGVPSAETFFKQNSKND